MSDEATYALRVTVLCPTAASAQVVAIAAEVSEELTNEFALLHPNSTPG